MTAHTAEMLTALPCHSCGYDLRAHPRDAKCPECGASVEESRRLAAIPLRPVWRDSDPRWRRRMLAGAWVLVLLPLMDTLQISGWASHVPVPNVFHIYGTVLTLNETFLFEMRVYQPLLFCIGVVLLFSKERGRRRGHLDWTRRWGVICSYVTLLLSAAPILFITALVSVGIAALFLSMPLRYQPRVAQLFVDVSTTYLRYGPQPKSMSAIVLITFSSIAVLLACIPLFDALRSSGPKRLAAILLAPLALFSLIQLAQVGRYCLGVTSVTPEEVSSYEWYFRPDLLVADIAALPGSLNDPVSFLSVFLVEAAKWCIVLAIAVWLSIARFVAWWGKNASAV